MRPKLLIFALLLASTYAYADKVYKWVDDQGNVLYTDQPRKGAQEIKIAASPPAGVARASEGTRRQVGSSSFASVETESVKYSAVKFGSPTNEETIRDNAGNVAVALNVVPDLVASRGHRVKLTLDGRPLDSDFSPPGVVLAGLDQGTHTLQATVTDKEGRALIKSDPVVFYLKSWSLDNPIGPGNYPTTYPPQPYTSVYPAHVYTPVYPPSGTPKPRR